MTPSGTRCYRKRYKAICAAKTCFSVPHRPTPPVATTAGILLSGYSPYLTRGKPHNPCPISQSFNAARTAALLCNGGVCIEPHRLIAARIAMPFVIVEIETGEGASGVELAHGFDVVDAFGIVHRSVSLLSCLVPRATICSAPSGNGRRNLSASATGAVIHVSISSGVRKMTGIALE